MEEFVLTSDRSVVSEMAIFQQQSANCRHFLRGAGAEVSFGQESVLFYFESEDV